MSGLAVDLEGWDVDTASLGEAITPDEVRAFRARIEGHPSFPPLGRDTPRVVGAILGYGGSMLVIDFVICSVFAVLAGAAAPQFPAAWWVTLVVTMAALAVPLSRWPLRRIGGELAFRGSWSRRAALDRLARRNSMSYLAKRENPAGLGTLFSRGSARAASDCFRTARVEVGNYRAGDGHIHSLAPYGWGYLRVKLDTRLPRLVVMPTGLRRSAVFIIPPAGLALPLEGDFDRHFTLFVPSGQERFALTVFTPDLMAALIDEAPGSFVELVNQQLVIAIPRPFDFTRAADWVRVSSILNTIGRRSARQTRSRSY